MVFPQDRRPLLAYLVLHEDTDSKPLCTPLVYMLILLHSQPLSSILDVLALLGEGRFSCPRDDRSIAEQEGRKNPNKGVTKPCSERAAMFDLRFP